MVTRGWNGYRNKSQHRKSTLENKILPPFQQGFEPATFQSRVRCSNHWAIPAPTVYARRAVTVNDDRLQDDDTLCMFVQRITRSFHYLNQSNTTSWLFCVLGTAFMARFQGTTSLGVRWGRGVNLHKVIYIHVLEHKHRQAANSQGVHKLRLSYVLAAI